MDSIQKLKYRTLCKTEKTIPIFLMDWWLDTVCDKESWDVVLIENGEGIIGALPYCVSKKFIFKFSKVPPLTGFLGPWIFYPQHQKYASRISYETEVLKTLIDQLPDIDLFRQRFHHSFTNWLPFYWKDFTQTTRYTYILDVRDTEKVYEEVKSSVRGKIRKASEIVRVVHDKPIDDFYRLFSMTFERQGIKAPVKLSYLQKIDQALLGKGQRKIFYAIDSESRIHSALYLIWDHCSAYVHMVGEDPELRNSGAGIFLIWNAISFTRNELMLDKFDFLGSMIEPIESVRRSFGAKQVPYFQIQKTNSVLLRLINAFKNSSKLT